MTEPAALRPDEPELAGRFRKDPEQERFLGELNAALASFEEERYDPAAEELPTLHVIGAPRSGTTLLYQVVAGGLDLGAVTNLVAAFWHAPVTGLRLARALRADRVRSDFESTFGRTHGIREPHEFGYFWNHHLRYPDLRERGPEHADAIDWDRLSLVIRNMARAAGAPMAFKPMLLVWHLERMVEAMPRACYVWIRRDRLATALSLLEMRRSLLGSFDGWTSLRPRAPLDDEPPWRQVAAQVVLLERTIAAAAQRLGPERILEVSYEELCEEPATVLERTRDLLSAHGHAPAIVATDLPRFDTHGPAPELEDEFGERVAAALADYERAR